MSSSSHCASISHQVPAAKDVPFLLCHGTSDPLVPPMLASVAENLLKSKGGYLGVLLPSRCIIVHVHCLRALFTSQDPQEGIVEILTLLRPLTLLAGFDASLKTYEGMAHSACPQELNDVTQFLSAVLPPSAPKPVSK